jgi:hypothetical protein
MNADRNTFSIIDVRLNMVKVSFESITPNLPLPAAFLRRRQAAGSTPLLEVRGQNTPRKRLL